MEIRRLEGWLTLVEAADILNITKQGMHRRVFETNMYNLDDLRKIGSKPIYLIRMSVVYL